MINKIKKNIDLELNKLLKNIDKNYGINTISPILHKSLKNFLERKGKRIRPLLFILGYRGFSNKNPRNLYRSALAIELMHSFLLIHDDILDNSDMRRGKPSMHILLTNSLPAKTRSKSIGSHLALISGDIIYALAIEAFTSIEESFEKKQKALLKFIESGFYTGCGEFIDIINSKKPISQISRKEIYQTYDYKTAYYSFSAPLITGAILAGADNTEIRKLFNFGKYCGRAFQIKDDILEIFKNPRQTGKSFTDIRENKKTILIWHAYKQAAYADKILLNKILSKNSIDQSDITQIKLILKRTGSLNYCIRLLEGLIEKAISCLESSHLKNTCKKELISHCRKTLEL